MHASSPVILMQISEILIRTFIGISRHSAVTFSVSVFFLAEERKCRIFATDDAVGAMLPTQCYRQEIM